MAQRKDNSIINSLKRLERVGSETSRVTQKLKKATEKVARELLKGIHNTGVEVNDFYIHIAQALYYTGSTLLWDYDGNMHNISCWDYNLIPDDRDVSRNVALDFSKAISNGLLEDVSKWVEVKKNESEQALRDIEQARL